VGNSIDSMYVHIYTLPITLTQAEQSKLFHCQT